MLIQNPRINLLFSEKRVLSLVILMFTGLLPFVPLKETHLEIYLPEIYQKRRVFEDKLNQKKRI